MGSGRTNVAEALFGITPSDGGEIRLDGQPCGSATRTWRSGRALPCSRGPQAQWPVPCLSVMENMEMAVLPHYVGGNGFIQQKALRALCEDMCKKLRVKTPSLEQCIDTLSGGNQQKALLARWLMTNPRILILDEPTRGIDVGAKAEIYRLIAYLASEAWR
ncbi:ATP-binding cassette domain-containing protein [Pseudomonas sp. PCH446]